MKRGNHEPEYRRRISEKTAHNRHTAERHWEHAGILGLWAAAAVGVAAIVTGNHDANRQRSVMIDQLEASKDAIEVTNRLADASQKSADIAQSSQRAWVGPT